MGEYQQFQGYRRVIEITNGCSQRIARSETAAIAYVGVISNLPMLVLSPTINHSLWLVLSPTTNHSTCAPYNEDRYYFGGQGKAADTFGYIERDKRAVFGKSYAAEPDKLIEELAADEAIQEADTLLLTIPNTLGVDYNVHVLSSILEHVAPGLGWR